MSARSEMIGVLIVEDEKIIREGLIRTFEWEQFGCEVIGAARDGQEGLEMIRNLQPDLVITDIRMPNMSGLDMIKASVEEKGAPVFIILSGYSDFNYAQQAIRLGARDYLLKPIDDKELKDVLSRAVEQIQNRQMPSAAPNHLKFEASVKNSPGDKYLQQAMLIIRKRYMQNLTLRGIADELGISESYLVKLFKSKSSYTYLDYLVLYRIKKAVELLETSDLKVYEISFKVGYSDSKYFGKIFQKIVGVKPSEYRNGYMLAEDNILNRLP